MTSCAEMLSDISVAECQEMEEQVGVEIFDELDPSAHLSSSVPHDIDLHLECYDDGNFSLPLMTDDSHVLSHCITGQNVRLRVSFPVPPKTTPKEEMTDKFTCTECEHQFKNHTKLAKHLLHEHKIANGYKCDLCSFSTTENRLLKRHNVNKHSRKKDQKTNGHSPQKSGRLLIIEEIQGSRVKREPYLGDPLKLCAAKKCVSEANTDNIAEGSLNPNEMIVNSCDDVDCGMTVSVNVVGTALTKGPDGTGCHWNDTEELTQISNTRSVPYCVDASSSHMGPGIANVQSFSETACVFGSLEQKHGQGNTKMLKNAECPKRSPEIDTILDTDEHKLESKELAASISKSSLTKDKGRNSSLQCDVCKKLFKTEKRLKRHSLIHISDKKFACSFEGCQKLFKYSDLLSSHVYKVHKKYNKLSSPREDRNLHNRSKFVCSWTNCGKSFRDNYNLKAHYCLHTGEKPVKCPQCPFKCAHKTSLKHHMKVMHS